MAETPGTHVGPKSPTSHRMLSEQGNPQLGSLTALLDALNLRLSITVK